MTDLLWIALPFVAALGSGALAYVVAQAKHEAALAREREQLAQVRTELLNQQKTVEDRLRAARAEARRQALDEFLADVRVEERRFVRELEAPGAHRKCLVLQERVCFRNIPLSQWIERELDMVTEAAALPEPAPSSRLVEVPKPRRLLR